MIKYLQKVICCIWMCVLIVIANYGQGCTSKQFNVTNYPGELCNRECDNEPRLCYFHFNLEHYQAMGVACGKCSEGVEEDCLHPQCVVADGVENGIMSINRQIPGPAIHVCKDDLVVVDVYNQAHGTAANIHWHGLPMQDTPFMDGVPFLTQCPILFNTAFRYQFYATQPGTHFYHPQVGHHKTNGQYGALIVRKPRNSFDYAKYDFDLPEHHIIINDWMHQHGEEHFPGLPSSHAQPDSILINSRGQYYDPEKKTHSQVTPTIYYVAPGKRYRFRLINSGNHVCPYEIQIEGHDLAIIAADSSEVFLYQSPSLISNSGERYDFIVNANRKQGDYLIRVRGVGVCAERNLESLAVLSYKMKWEKNNFQLLPFPLQNKLLPSSKYLNHLNDHFVTELFNVIPKENLGSLAADYKFLLAFQNHVVPNEEIFEKNQYTVFLNTEGKVTVKGTINKLSLLMPDFPLLTQPDLIDESKFCNLTSIPAACDNKTVCSCVHRLKVKLNSVVEFTLVDETEENDGISYPFHLHGYRFMVTGMGQNYSEEKLTKSMCAVGDVFAKDKRNKGCAFKDTVSVPSKGYVVAKFRATNPGFWLMHCQSDLHFSNGMALILQVGETSEMVKAPTDFPQCSSYVPDIFVK